MSPDQPHVRRRPGLARTWLVLVLLTLAAFLFMEATGASAGPATATVIIVLAFVKVGLIGARFMELHAAPVALRAAFGTWLIGTGGLLVILLLAR